ncbi:hypothetical protein [Gardnerella vaginalis]|uniref:hypothetical protein n=1 Tax=Gardnerella TaxID=2701 RepID=UPI000413AFB8|nr:hypothetical protein [Gardnerella vaginalis]
MDIEEALAGLLAALRAGSTFVMIIQADTKIEHYSSASVMNTELIYQWLATRCLTRNREITDSQRRRLERHMHHVAENLMTAYQLSNTLGCAMATCVEATAASYHAQRRAEDLRADVAAMPQATIKLLTALPFLALLAGELLGGHPLLMLSTTVHGWILLALGAVCYSLGLAWVRSMLRISQHAMDSAIVGG